jgi:hypothetical protein
MEETKSKKKSEKQKAVPADLREDVSITNQRLA